MKNTKLNHCKMALLALASVVLLAPAVRAQVSANLDDLVVGFRATGGLGAGNDLEVDLGNMSNFYYAASSTIPLPALAVQDLSDTFGANWYTRTDLVWGAAASDGRSAGTPDGYAPLKTLWVTAPGSTVWTRGTTFAMGTPSANIEELYSGALGSLAGATSTTNSSAAAVILASYAGSYTAQDLKNAGESFGYFNPTIDSTADLADAPGNQVMAQLYEMRTGTGAGTSIGQLVLTESGLTFDAIPEPSTATLIVLGLGSLMLYRRPKSVRA